MVLVCHPQEFVFLKTRKTAGTSVEMLLQPYCVPPGTPVEEPTPYLSSEYGIVGRRVKAGPRPKPWHMRTHAYAIEAFLTIGPAKWRRYRKISCVRNPFDRMVSYFHWIFGRDLPANSDFSDIRTKFSEFVLSNNWKTDRMAAHLFGRYCIDHMIRFEHMAEDIARLNTETGLNVDSSSLVRTKISKRKAHDVPDYFDEQTIEHVKKRLHWVFDRFEYPEHPVPKNIPEQSGSSA